MFRFHCFSQVSNKDHQKLKVQTDRGRTGAEDLANNSEHVLDSHSGHQGVTGMFWHGTVKLLIAFAARSRSALHDAAGRMRPWHTFKNETRGVAHNNEPEQNNTMKNDHSLCSSTKSWQF
jgi:hypothetical protein